MRNTTHYRRMSKASIALLAFLSLALVGSVYLAWINLQRYHAYEVSEARV